MSSSAIAPGSTTFPARRAADCSTTRKILDRIVALEEPSRAAGDQIARNSRAVEIHDALYGGAAEGLKAARPRQD